MYSENNSETYVAFLRGINVGGYHKLPMANLKKEIQKQGFWDVKTILNSSNVIFKGNHGNMEGYEESISRQLEQCFGFSVPTLIRSSSFIYNLTRDNPFKEIEISKDKRLYVSFLKSNVELDLKFPWSSYDRSFKILSNKDRMVISVLDLSVSQTPKGMEALSDFFGENITTRNWNTITRIKNNL